jgi:hypothetical protein
MVTAIFSTLLSATWLPMHPVWLVVMDIIVMAEKIITRENAKVIRYMGCNVVEYQYLVFGC